MANWENLSGNNNWNGLLKPLNQDLGRHIIHYGEMVEAAYNAHDPDENSTTGCMYKKEDLFSKVGLQKGKAQKKYDITMFIYATASHPPFKDTNWFGYVAVATDDGKRELGRRDIVVAWRGTKEGWEWTNNMFVFKRVPSKMFGKHNRLTSFMLRNLPGPWSSSASPKLNVHSGFYQLYTSNNKDSKLCKISAQDLVIKEISRLVKKYASETISVTVTGHSLGGALAILNAADIEINVLKDWNYTSPRPRVTAFVFGCPQVGDLGLKNLVEAYSQNLHILRIENRPDIIPKLLRLGSESESEVRSFLEQDIDTDNIGLDLLMIKNMRESASELRSITGFEDVGQVLLINTDNSRYLKPEKGLAEAKLMAHNMEVYLHGVLGTQGVNASFVEDVEIERSIPLVNKHGDYLDKRFEIPASWWDQVDKAKMVQDEDGSWYLKTRNRDSIKKVIKKIFH